MKNLILYTTIILFSTIQLSAQQQWSGSQNTLGNIQRDGKVTLVNSDLSVINYSSPTNVGIGFATSARFNSGSNSIVEYGMTRLNNNQVGLSSWNGLNFYTANFSAPRLSILANGNLQLSHESVANVVNPTSNTIFWDWDGRGIDQVSPDGISRIIRFKNSMSVNSGNPLGGFAFTDHLGTSVMRIKDYKVGIGTENPDKMLTVKGTIHAEEVLIDLNVPADYVFEKYYAGFSLLNPNYTMLTLQEVEEFTKKNNHLPEMPSAQEVKENGLELGEMTNLLLQKIEELTLYTIEQEKRIKALEDSRN